MLARKYISIVLILLLSIFVTGCEDACESCEDSLTSFQGDPGPLKGSYLITMKQDIQSTSDKLLGKKPERREFDSAMTIDVKDPKTLMAKIEPDGEPFYLDYNPKTGVAKGKDSQGYNWEIAFAVDHEAKYDEEYIVMDSIKRTGTSLLGVGSDTAKGESTTGLFYQYHGNWHPKKEDPGRQGNFEYIHQ